MVERQLIKALGLFCFKPLEDQLHVPQDSDVYDEIKNKNPQTFVRPLFLPSIASNGKDVERELSKNSKFNPDTVNAAILALTLYAYIMSAYSGKSLPEVMNDKTRITNLNYYLRFHNSHGECNPIKKVYAAFAEKYKQSYDTKGFGLCYKSTVMLGMLDIILIIFNSYLLIEAENVTEKNWMRDKHILRTCQLNLGLSFPALETTERFLEEIITWSLWFLLQYSII